tara:strand:- start:14247 stop:15041 length:795 start_codon:yes stop_codon:yes gene_type:complete
MLNKLTGCIVLIFFTVSCAKQWSYNEVKSEKLPKLKQKEFIKLLDSISVSAPHYMYTKVKVSYIGADNRGSFKTTLKAVKDSAVSAVVSFARIPVFSALIDTSKLTIVNKKDKCFSAQKLSEFSKNIGVDLAFNNIEEVIFGHAIGFSKDQKYHMLNDPYQYILSTHRKGGGRKKKEIVYRYNMASNKTHLVSSHISAPLDSTEIEIKYLEWQKADKYLLPMRINMNIQSKGNFGEIILEYTRLDALTPEALFITIPEKYEKCN